MYETNIVDKNVNFGNLELLPFGENVNFVSYQSNAYDL